MTGNIIYSCISAYATILKKMILTSNKREKKARVEEGLKTLTSTNTRIIDIAL